jgi:hypothetical protein
MGRDFGGWGGVSGGRPRDLADDFENAVERAMGERLRQDRASGADANGPGLGMADLPGGAALGHRLWGSLANVSWAHENGDTASYTFRAAGDLIASIIGAGDYMDWYCSHEYGVVDPEIAELMAVQGWRPVPEVDEELAPKPAAPDQDFPLDAPPEGFR